MFAPSDLTEDAFLGGRLRLKQPKFGYRAGIDPVLLASAVPARPSETVLELGIGAAAASLCLAARVEGLRLTGLEVQPDYAALARENAAANGIALNVVEGDVSDLPAEVRAQSFDHVIMNPPYFLREHGTPAVDTGREAAMGEQVELAIWLEAGARRLKPGGRLTVIQRADRLPDILAGCSGLGSFEVRPIAARTGRSAHLVIVTAQKSGRAKFQLRAPLILHEGPRHEKDGESYRVDIQEVLRNAAELPR